MRLRDLLLTTPSAVRTPLLEKEGNGPVSETDPSPPPLPRKPVDKAEGPGVARSHSGFYPIYRHRLVRVLQDSKFTQELLGSIWIQRSRVHQDITGYEQIRELQFR